MNKNDPKWYRRMCEPFVDVESANAALVAFFADVEAAREKHRISDVNVIAEVSHDLDGEEVRGSSSMHLGDSARALPMLAREYGRASQRHEDHMAKLIAGGRKAVRR